MEGLRVSIIVLDMASWLLVLSVSYAAWPPLEANNACCIAVHMILPSEAGWFYFVSFFGCFIKHRE
jgi:hypothetical protein